MSAQAARFLLVPSQTTTVSGSKSTAGASAQLGRFRRGLVLLDVTAAAAAVGDTLDVYIQKNCGGIDGSTQVDWWTDFVHFTQVLGNGGAKQFVAELVADGGAPTSALHVLQDAALTAGVNQGPWSDTWRIKWVVAGATPSFTWRMFANMED